MSEIAYRQQEAPLLERQFEDVAISEGDGRTLEGLCVPYNVPATVADPPHFQPYQEMFVKGAFGRALKAPNRVWVDFEHQTDIGNLLGRGIEFEERDDGLYGRLHLFNNDKGNTALELVRSKVLEGLSIMFKPVKDLVEDGVVKRVAVHLDRIALVRQGAYKEAQVLAVRSAPILPPLPMLSDELRTSLEHFGIRVPGDAA